MQYGVVFPQIEFAAKPPLKAQTEHFIERDSGASYGNLYGMKTTIDAAGRLVIPKDIRQQVGLRPGMPLDVRVREGRIEIEPAPLQIKLKRRGRLLVAVPQESVSPLTTEIVEETRRKVRRERGGNE